VSHISPDNRKTQEIFKCISCGYTNNADLVAAINILAACHVSLWRGSVSRLLDESGTSPKGCIMQGNQLGIAVLHGGEDVNLQQANF